MNNVQITIDLDELILDMKHHLSKSVAFDLLDKEYNFGFEKGMFKAFRGLYLKAGGDINKVEDLRREVLGD